MKKLTTLLTVFSFLVIQGLGAQSNEIIADSIYVSGNSKLALKEYLRAYVTEPEHCSNAITLKISRLYREVNQFEKALNFADIYYFGVKEEDKKNIALVEKIKTYILINDSNSALLESTQMFEKTYQQKNLKFFYQGYISLLNNDFEKAKSDFKKLSYLKAADLENIDRFVNEVKKIEDKDHRWAMLQSALLPGLGQAVNGNIKDGANSFVLLGSLSVVFFQIYKSLSFTDAIVSVGPWASRYYIGGILNASDQAKSRKNDLKNQKITDLVFYIKNAQQTFSTN
jgi:hypothetical protein